MNENKDKGSVYPMRRPHNVYSGYLPNEHNRLCSRGRFDDHWVAEQLSAERNAERSDLIFSHILCMLIGAAVVLAVLT